MCRLQPNRQERSTALLIKDLRDLLSQGVFLRKTGPFRIGDIRTVYFKDSVHCISERICKVEVVKIEKCDGYKKIHVRRLEG